MISDHDKAFLLSLKPEDLTFTMLVSLIGDTTSSSKGISKETKSRFNTTDEMILEPREYFVKQKTTTTVGRFIFNKYIVERVGLQDVLGYVNTPVTAKGKDNIESILSGALVSDKITVDQFYNYIDYRDFLGLQLNGVLALSFSQNTMRIPPNVKKRRAELFKQYDKELSNGDVIVSEKIEKELQDMAKKEFEGDPGLEMYNSGARGNFGNYKNMYLFKGAAKNVITGEYEILKSSFMDGISKKDIPAFGESVVTGTYPKSVGTAESGYMSKQLMASMQSETIDEHGTDCGTKKTLNVNLTEKNSKDFEYRYIQEGGKAICLTPEDMPKYIGKTVKLRSPMYCLGDKICNICAGELNYKLGMLNAGLGCAKLGTTLVNLGMKKFHISTLKSNQIDVDNMLI